MGTALSTPRPTVGTSERAAIRLAPVQDSKLPRMGSRVRACRCRSATCGRPGPARRDSSTPRCTDPRTAVLRYRADAGCADRHGRRLRPGRARLVRRDPRRALYHADAQPRRTKSAHARRSRHLAAPTGLGRNGAGRDHRGNVECRPRSGGPSVDRRAGDAPGPAPSGPRGGPSRRAPRHVAAPGRRHRTTTATPASSWGEGSSDRLCFSAVLGGSTCGGTRAPGPLIGLAPYLGRSRRSLFVRPSAAEASGSRTGAVVMGGPGAGAEGSPGPCAVSSCALAAVVVCAGRGGAEAALVHVLWCEFGTHEAYRLSLMSRSPSYRDISTIYR